MAKFDPFLSFQSINQILPSGNTGQHIVAPLNKNRPLTYSESDNDSDEFGATEFRAAQALASKNRIVKMGRPPPGTVNDYPGPIHVS